jgi:hypothetical protein
MICRFTTALKKGRSSLNSFDNNEAVSLRVKRQNQRFNLCEILAHRTIGRVVHVVGLIDRIRNGKRMAGGGTIMAGGGMAREMTLAKRIAGMAQAGQKVQALAHHRNKCELGRDNQN